MTVASLTKKEIKNLLGIEKISSRREEESFKGPEILASRILASRILESTQFYLESGEENTGEI